MQLQIFFVLALFILGAAVGSFTSVVIYRMHKGEKGIFRGRSKCTNCETQLNPLDLVPIASYLVLRGKCRYCSKAISYMYPTLEVVSGAIFALLFWKFPFVDGAMNFSSPFVGMYALYAFYAFVLIFTFFYDLHYLEVSDEIMLPAILVAFIVTLAAPLTPNFVDALLGALVGAAFFGIQYLVSKGTWIGLGDLRIGAFMGAIFGLKLVIVALFVSYILGSVVALIISVRKRKLVGVKIPFAPILVTGTFITIFFGTNILTWYIKLLGL